MPHVHPTFLEASEFRLLKRGDQVPRPLVAETETSMVRCLGILGTGGSGVALREGVKICILGWYDRTLAKRASGTNEDTRRFERYVICNLVTGRPGSRSPAGRVSRAAVLNE